jgi:hypothetical protein
MMKLMRKFRKAPTFLLLLTPTWAQAIVYYQSKGGALLKINEDAFKGCTNFIYRTSGKDDLPAAFKRKALNALMRGDVVNEPGAASTAAKATEGTCTYSDKDDLK